MLKVESLVVNHKAKRLMGPVSLSVEPGRSLVIMGETGAGKSLIAQAIMGALPAALQAVGEIWLHEKRVDQLDTSERQALWGLELAMLPQEPWRALDPLMRSGQQVYETYRYVNKLSHRASIKAVDQQLQQLDLLDAKRKRPGELSGGMGQRFAFCAAVAGGAPLLLADEPTKGLDLQRSATIVDQLRAVPESGGALLVITHDVAVAEKVGGDLIVVKNGDVVETGDTRSVLSNPMHDYTRQLINAHPQHWPSVASNAASQPHFTLTELVAGHNEFNITAPVSLTVNRGSRIAITGPSGVGKSTLLDTIAGLLKPISGVLDKHVEFNTTDIQKVYQDPPAAFPAMVTLGTSLRDVCQLHKVPWSQVQSLLARLGIDESLLERKPDAVSGGELQRISIARALLVKPKVLLADEPTSRLDPITQRDTMQLLAEIAADSDTAVLLVTHDTAIAEKWTDQTIRLNPSN